MTTGENTLRVDRSNVVRSISFAGDRIKTTLDDGRSCTLSLVLYPSLSNAPAAIRSNCEVLGDGVGFHWPDFDLDLSTDQLIQSDAEAIPAAPNIDPNPPINGSSASR